jgi:hypothetical protein
MRDRATAEAETKPEPAAGSERLAPSGYVPPRLTKVGNVRDLLAGEGGTVADIDPTSGNPQQSSPQG